MEARSSLIFPHPRLPNFSRLIERLPDLLTEEKCDRVETDSAETGVTVVSQEQPDRLELGSVRSCPDCSFSCCTSSCCSTYACRQGVPSRRPDWRNPCWTDMEEPAAPAAAQLRCTCGRHVTAAAVLARRGRYNDTPIKRASKPWPNTQFSQHPTPTPQPCN